MAITEAATLFNLLTTVKFDTTVTINGTVITGSIMTNDDATGLTYFNVFSEATTDAKLSEQMSTVIKYFEKFNYAITRTSTNGFSITWNLSW